MMFAVITKNGKIANERQHFPISRSAGDFNKRIAMFETKNWITAAEAATIKRAKPSFGGHHFLYAMHCLDNKRKHETLVRVSGDISQAQITAMGLGIEPGLHYLNDKTVLFRIHKSRRFRPSEGNTFLSLEMIVDEPTCGIDKKPAVLLLRNFVHAVRGLITAFHNLPERPRCEVRVVTAPACSTKARTGRRKHSSKRRGSRRRLKRPTRFASAHNRVAQASRSRPCASRPTRMARQALQGKPVNRYAGDRSGPAAKGPRVWPPSLAAGLRIAHDRPAGVEPSHDRAT